ncbi:MAG: hypothetical protein QW584_04030 [Thermofilaceae archaeon]
MREVRRYKDDVVVVYRVVLSPRGGCLHSDVVETLLYYLREMRIEDVDDLINNNVNVMMDIKTTFTLHYYCYKELKLYIICF